MPRTLIKDYLKTDIKFYGKIHFDRKLCSDNETFNIHCHLIAAGKTKLTKDVQKLSLLTNHKNSFKERNGNRRLDRVNSFWQAEQGFDKLFGCKSAKLSESFQCQQYNEEWFYIQKNNFAIQRTTIC